MRAVSFVSRLEFIFKGNVSKNAVCLGDVDNDTNSELAVGNLQGDLAVFKKEHKFPWAEAHDLGMVMVVIIGDILNIGKNFTICISGEGLCTLFEIKNEYNELERRSLLPFYSQKLPANTKVALLTDVDNDGELELILGLTDHVLRTYRWVKLGQGPNDLSGKLVGLHKLELADQIGSISLNPSNNGSPFILVAQSGGTYMHFQCLLENDEIDENGPDSLKLTTPVHHALASSRMRNPNISSEILGGICGVRNGKPTDSLIAVATLDGTLMLVDGDEILWSFQVDHQLFAITKLDLIGNGEEGVIACAWDGQTYMVNQEKQSVRFQFDEPVSAFTSGKYSVSSGSSVPAIVYATFSDRVFLYSDIQLPSFSICNFLETMEKQPDSSDLLTQFPINREDKRHLRSLFSYCLYDFPNSNNEEELKDIES
ncbi:KICSTOR complex protein ITFG2 [Parasteatoda tepidariorum]|uniref:KICSTOR complex protein ITFG2 n=1 Tax=Parasteatoda tepidariorum TaxID=114398 RepID=UPI00077FD7F5|nr:KICSTOR complex protein ITFG2 [Parasteatoda tepidariorum]